MPSSGLATYKQASSPCRRRKRWTEYARVCGTRFASTCEAKGCLCGYESGYGESARKRDKQYLSRRVGFCLHRRVILCKEVSTAERNDAHIVGFERQLRRSVSGTSATWQWTRTKAALSPGADIFALVRIKPAPLAREVSRANRQGTDLQKCAMAGHRLIA